MLRFRRWLAKVIANEIGRNLNVKVFVRGSYSGDYGMGDLYKVGVQIEVWYRGQYIYGSEDET